MTETKVEALIRNLALTGSSARPREMRILRRALLGRYVIWASFDEAEPSRSPFEKGPRTAEAVRTALGLGHCSETETLILLTYGTEVGGLPLCPFLYIAPRSPKPVIFAGSVLIRNLAHSME